VTAAVPLSPHAREARRSLLRRRLRETFWSLAIWMPIAVVGASLREFSGMPREVAVVAAFASTGILVVGLALYGRSRRGRARARRSRETYLENLHAAAPALTPAERDRALKTLKEGDYGDDVVAEIRGLLESLPGGMRPLPALCVKDPDDWFRASGPLKLRALLAYPAGALLLAWGIVAISRAGFEPIEWIGLASLLLPGVLIWNDDDLADAQPGERAAWSLAATFMFFVWLVAGLLAIGA
jgi:hypothetical protein